MSDTGKDFDIAARARESLRAERAFAKLRKIKAASAGEAGTAKTEGLGPKDEHAAPEGGDAQ